MHSERGVKKKKIENMKKKPPIRPFLAHPAGGQETTFYLRVALLHDLLQGNHIPSAEILGEPRR